LNTTKSVRLWEPPRKRDLQVSFLRHPRGFAARHYDWDLDRGFRLEVLGPQSIGVTVKDQHFLLWIAANFDGSWPNWSRQDLQPDTVCAILSRQGVACPVPKDWPNLVLWVRQYMPVGTHWSGNDFFTPEQNLYQWGRVGRRVRRRTRWRSWLPW